MKMYSNWRVFNYTFLIKMSSSFFPQSAYIPREEGRSTYDGEFLLGLALNGVIQKLDTQLRLTQYSAL